MAGACFHCGDALPAGEPLLAVVGGEPRPMCCPGCKAVAEFIDGEGMGAFYAHRGELPGAGELRPDASDYRRYDVAGVAQRFVSVRDGRAVASIDIGGMYCSACSWLLDRSLRRHAAIHSVDISPAAHRAVISWDSDAMSFGELLSAIAAVGFAPRPAAETGGSADAEYRGALRRLIVAAAAGMQVMMFAFAMYAGDHFGIEGGIERFLRTVSLLVTLPIVFYSARPFFAGAWRGLRSGMPGMDVPVALAITIAFTASLAAVWRGEGAVYFDSVAMFVLFLSGTRFLEMRARHRSGDLAQALSRLLPETARKLGDDGGECFVSVDTLAVGDVLRVLPGDIVPADARVLEGELRVDESMLSGESMPVRRAAGCDVFAGASVASGSAVVEVTRTGADSSVAEIGRLLDRAQADRPRLAQLADRVASWFVVAMLLVAAVTAVAWFNHDASRAVEILLATLVVTCPCALALATPAALAAASARLARSGCFLVRSRLLQVLRPGATIIFDKTGTLTRGTPEVTATTVCAAAGGRSADDCLALAATLERASEHVLARAFVPYRDGAQLPPADAIPYPGCGVEGIVDGERLRIGSESFVRELGGAAWPDEPDDAVTGTVVCLGSERGLLARFTVADALRDGAFDTVAALRDAGFHVAIASGDRRAAVADAAGRLGIDDWHAGMSPVDKLALVRERRSAGHAVVMIGDGINDAPVLAAADASIAIDAGTALARASADAIVLGRKLGAVQVAVRVAAATRRVVVQNLAWAAGYNAAAVPLAASGLLAPWMAALGMSLSSLLVVLNALRLRRLAPLGDAVAAAAVHHARSQPA